MSHAHRIKVCLGGTFDPLHKGHKLLLREALRLADALLIGLTSDKMARAMRALCVRDYEVRIKGLEEWAQGLLKTLSKKVDINIVPLSDKYGPALTEDFDYIVVSPETLRTAKELNRKRERAGKAPIAIHAVPFVLADDGLPISSTRIKPGKIDADGNLKRAMVMVGSTDRAELDAVRHAFKMVFEHTELVVKGVDAAVGTAKKPLKGDAVIRGARQRAARALEGSDADFGVGIEAGLFFNRVIRRYMGMQYCAIIDRGGRLTFGHGPGFCYPYAVLAKAKEGIGMEKATEVLYGSQVPGREQDAVGSLSRELTDSEQMTTQTVLMALMPRMTREHYGL